MLEDLPFSGRDKPAMPRMPAIGCNARSMLRQTILSTREAIGDDRTAMAIAPKIKATMIPMTLIPTADRPTIFVRVAEAGGPIANSRCRTEEKAPIGWVYIVWPVSFVLPEVPAFDRTLLGWGRSITAYFSETTTPRNVWISRCTRRDRGTRLQKDQNQSG